MHPSFAPTSVPQVQPPTATERNRTAPTLAVAPPVGPDPKGIEPLYTHWVAG